MSILELPAIRDGHEFEHESVFQKTPAEVAEPIKDICEEPQRNHGPAKEIVVAIYYIRTGCIQATGISVLMYVVSLEGPNNTARRDRAIPT